jgi:hypothetical protein
MNEMENKARRAAINYAIYKFNLPFNNVSFTKMKDYELNILENILEDWIEPEERDMFYDIMEAFRDGYLAGCLLRKEEKYEY